jgi:hypothetical protein
MKYAGIYAGMGWNITKTIAVTKKEFRKPNFKSIILKTNPLK